MGATVDGYDGIPYDELPIDAVEVRPEQEEHLARRRRTGAPHEVDIEPSWVVEVALDPRALVDDGRSRTGLSFRVIGLAPSCPAVDGDPRGAVLVVYLVPATAPRDGHWLVVTGWLAGQQLRRIYWEKSDE
ncbi:MAG: hypothetical protein ABIZ05_09730 [Pseudonocardiaceae bacterium]